MPEPEISDEAIIAATFDDLEIEVVRNIHGDFFEVRTNYAEIGVGLMEALAAQRKLDARYEVTDEMVDAFKQAVESSHDSDITDEGLHRLRKFGLEAVMQHLKEADNGRI